MATTLEGRLDSIELLKSLSPADMRQLEKQAVWRRYAAGEQVLDRSSMSRDVFFVVQGRVNVVNYSLGGREIAYASVGAGGFFGELSAIDGEPRSASVVAAERCLVATVTPEIFNDVLLKNPQIMHLVLSRLVRIIRTSNERIMDLSTLGAVQRVHLELLRMAEPDPLQPNSWLIYPMPTQSQIAGRASTTRETVARVISQLQSSGIVRRKDKSLYIKDRARLEAVAARLGPSGEE
ncbi:MAG: Crp/Fnr family transcriptional regulator [Alphaproteobacteria bacterium]|nr:Crp/Fnr family transcriptional regulator [Alphaproteobacteria bacterium]